MRCLISLILLLLSACSYSFQNYQDPYLTQCHTSNEIISHYKNELKKNKIKLVVKRKGVPTRSITLRRMIRLRDDWHNLSETKKAIILSHEYVHTLQWRKEKAFMWKYLFSDRFRLNVETEAYKATVRSMRSMNVPKDVISNNISVVSNTISNGYLLSTLKKTHVHDELYRILENENKICQPKIN